MTNSLAFATGTIPASLRGSAFTPCNAVTSVRRDSRLVVCARPRRVLRMVGEPPSPPTPAPELDGVSEGTTEGTTEEGVVETGDADSAKEAVLDAVMSVGEETMGSEGGVGASTIIEEDDDLADVEVEQECEPPQWYQNGELIKAAQEKFRTHEGDTGSPEFQIATLTTRIEYMTAHLREHPKDYSSTRGLLKMVATRMKLLKYLKRKDEKRFNNIITGLNIRVSQQLRSL